jgi:hypothetical protein
VPLFPVPELKARCYMPLLLHGGLRPGCRGRGNCVGVGAGRNERNQAYAHHKTHFESGPYRTNTNIFPLPRTLELPASMASMGPIQNELRFMAFSRSSVRGRSAILSI